MNSATSNSESKRKTFSSARSEAVDDDLNITSDDDVFVSTSQARVQQRWPSRMIHRSHSSPECLPDLLKNIPICSYDDPQNPSGAKSADTNSLMQVGDGKDVGNPKKVINRSKSVHFETPEDEAAPISAHGQESRQVFRNLKSSGYGTGESSLQSQASQRSDFSDSCAASSSTELPYLSIFQSSTQLSDSHTVYIRESMNVPDLSIFEKTSGGSLRLDPGLDCFDEPDSGTMMATCDPQVETQDSTTSPTLSKLYDEKILEESMQQGSCPLSQTHADAKRILTDIALMHHGDKQQLARCLLEMSSLEMATPQHMFDLANTIQQIMSDSSTPPPPSVSPHTMLQYAGTDIFHEENTEEADQILQDLYENEYRAETNLSNINFYLIRILERAYRCHDQMCRDEECCKVKKLINNFKTAVQCNQQPKKTDIQLLYSLRAHSERCDALKCSVPWCALLNKVDPWDVSEAINEIFTDFEGPILTLCEDPESTVQKFLFLGDDDVLSSGTFTEGKDWYVLSPLTESGSVFLVQDFRPKLNAVFVVKKAVLLDYDQQWRVYENLRGLNWEHVVQHHWVMERDTALFICTEFHHSGTLLQRIEEQGHLQPGDVAVFMRQIMDGVRALHLRGILYLNWTSCNMLLVNNRTVKISNLSISVRLTGDEDYSEIKNCLPAVILPPEFLTSTPNLTLASDSWGCGCLVLELLSGKRVWHGLRHCSQEEIWNKLSKKASPPVPADVGYFAQVLDACWKIPQTRRKSLHEIQQMLR
ncbi:uncharacterized protein LOC121371901 [Gigantopelta aegis]|uniref:uncharacterized protein LOC121371901 n=1 Tax=Gigantopelta aegis TaxID=1735272 RepID=UPI001B88B8D4|nr:uncharacterized protein LOC121371901 [Gigantopelta aegis]XP_041354066.1 uncharacterized protein LOC121371901 [Gigantopelta aegis]